MMIIILILFWRNYNLDFNVIMDFLAMISPYVCAFWAIFYMILNHNIQKRYLVERSKIREILNNDFNIDLDKDVFGKM